MDEDKNTSFGGKEYIGKFVNVIRKPKVDSHIDRGLCTEITTSGVLIQIETERGTIYRKIPWNDIENVDYIERGE